MSVCVCVCVLWPSWWCCTERWRTWAGPDTEWWRPEQTKLDSSQKYLSPDSRERCYSSGIPQIQTFFFSFLFPRTILSILQTPGCCYLLLFDESVWTRSTCMSVLTRFHGDEGTEAPSELTRALPVANLWQNFYNTNSTTELNLWPLNFRKLILNCNLWGKSHYKMTDD